MLIKILIVLAVLVLGLVLVASLQSPDFKVVRSTGISASPALVFAEVNDLQNWRGWSPWEKVDPALKRSYEGAAVGTGSIYAWEGNSEVGAGRMTIVESRPNELLRIKLEFLKPFAATNDAEFTFKAADGKTTVTWSMSGRKNFVTKAVGLFMNMDKMIGGQFEEGLSNLKALCEAGSKR